MPAPVSRVTPEIEARMIAAIADGRPVYRATAENGITALDWVRAVIGNPELAAAVRHAEHARAQRLMDEALEIADTDLDPHRARVRTHVRMKSAGAYDRNKFGESIPQTVNVAVAIDGALAEARGRVLNAVLVPALPSPPTPGRAEYSTECDPGATTDEVPFYDPMQDQGDSIATRPDKVARELAEMVRLPRTLGDALD